VRKRLSFGASSLWIAAFLCQDRLGTNDRKLAQRWRFAGLVLRRESQLDTVGKEEEEELAMDAAFVAIGHDPNTAIFRDDAAGPVQQQQPNSASFEATNL
jgi:thioredoxin reductase